MLNPQFNFRAPQNLITPNGTAGWQTIGTLMNGAAGLMTYLDAKKRAEKMNKAQDDYYEMLKSYLENKQSNNTPAQVATPAPVENVEQTNTEPKKNALDEELAWSMANFREQQKTPYQKALENLMNGGNDTFGFLKNIGGL